MLLTLIVVTTVELVVQVTNSNDNSILAYMYLTTSEYLTSLDMITMEFAE